MRRGAVAALVALAVLAGCGDEEDEPAATAPATTTADGSSDPDVQEGGGDEPSAGDETTAERRPPTAKETIELVLTGATTAADICDSRVTEDYVRTAYGAREGCIAAQRPGALADSIRIEQVDESGDAAGAVVIPDGGPYDGIEVEVELVREHAVWRVDSLIADVPAGP